ncbi:hypothetical protein LL998_33220 (plasmid) [Burkholderia ambifaria]|uniref:hypothetical protein n=1 Tax=Burkholderia ambifaria TaxID=152480 RepID=UPI001E3AFEEE|nr:hypothetical protein [Burkholderia ambifaria]UEP39800.1 hypothetical protein LL998_33220 [Burkholderia ambifaria]
MNCFRKAAALEREGRPLASRIASFSMNTILDSIKAPLETGVMPFGACNVAMERVEVATAQTTISSSRGMASAMRKKNIFKEMTILGNGVGGHRVIMILFNRI